MNRAELRRIVADVLEVDPELLTPDTDLKEIETFDSVRVLTLMLELDAQMGVKISPEDASKLRYYGDIERIATQQGFALAA